MSAVTISLPDSLRDFVERQVAGKGYGNVSEYFRTLLREAQSREADARLQALLVEGLCNNEAEAVAADPQFWQQLRAEAARLIAAQPGARRAAGSGAVADD